MEKKCARAVTPKSAKTEEKPSAEFTPHILLYQIKVAVSMSFSKRTPFFTLYTYFTKKVEKIKKNYLFLLKNVL